MPAACAADLREELLARVWGPTVRAASRRDAELAAEMDALGAARRLMPPDDWEPDELTPDPTCGPPDGADAWLADLPAELLFEYLAATEDPPCREAIVAGRLPRQPGDGWPPGDGCGFAAGGVADELPPGPVLAGLAGDAWTAGLGRLSDDELIGVLRAARRLASWSAALELAAAFIRQLGNPDRAFGLYQADRQPGAAAQYTHRVTRQAPPPSRPHRVRQGTRQPLSSGRTARSATAWPQQFCSAGHHAPGWRV
jgi:hypothetical protein